MQAFSQDGSTGKCGTHNHMKIMNKLENNHHSEPPEIKLKQSPINMSIEKTPHQDL